MPHLASKAQAHPPHPLIAAVRRLRCTPPFEFTCTCSTNVARSRKSKVLEIRTQVSHEMSVHIPVQEEGTYEKVTIKLKTRGIVLQRTMSVHATPPSTNFLSEDPIFQKSWIVSYSCC